MLEPITIAVAPDARLYSVPEIVKAETPGDSVCEPTTYSDAEFGVMMEEPIVIGAAVACGTSAPAILDVELPTTSTVCEPEVCKATTVVDAPLPRVIDPPGDKVADL